ncbi:MAG: OmpA family protein [Taibaiella sp.]|nr:OmpA family protein [Taibaiella sp.]
MKKIIILTALFASVTLTGFSQDKAADMLATLNREGKIALYINFETSKAEINAESAGIISQIAEMMNEDKQLKISVEGHTDNAGQPKTNQALSESRAKAVAQGIISKGVPVGRVTSKGWGATKPLADNNTEDAKARNRRVEIVKVK